jgi:hypothetical protein
MSVESVSLSKARELAALPTFFLAAAVGVVLPVIQFCFYIPHASWGIWFWVAIFLAPLLISTAMVYAGANAFALPLGFACGILPGAFIVGLLVAMFVKVPHQDLSNAISLLMKVSLSGPFLYGGLSFAGASIARFARWAGAREWRKS